MMAAWRARKGIRRVALISPRTTAATCTRRGWAAGRVRPIILRLQTGRGVWGPSNRLTIRRPTCRSMGSTLRWKSLGNAYLAWLGSDIDHTSGHLLPLPLLRGDLGRHSNRSSIPTRTIRAIWISRVTRGQRVHGLAESCSLTRLSARGALSQAAGRGRLGWQQV